MEQKVLDENTRLREELQEQLLLEERAKRIVAAHMYHSKKQKEFLIEKIQFLKEQITQSIAEISTYKLEDTSNLQLDETGDIKAGTVEKLIESLYLQMNENDRHQSVFLVTHRSFTSTREVLSHLISSYKKFANNNIQSAEVYRIRIVNFMKKLLDDFDIAPSDRVWSFMNSTHLLQEILLRFVNEQVAGTDASLASILRKSADARVSRGMARTLSHLSIPTFTAPPPAPVVPKVLNPPIQFLDIHPMEFARQLTYLDSNLCRAIEAKEFLGLAFSKKDKQSRSPNLVKMTEHFNNISRWMAWLLVSEPNIKKRTKVLKHQIEVLQYLRELQNFNGIFQIIGAFESAPVHRLHKTFDVCVKVEILFTIQDIKAERTKQIQDCKFLCDTQKNWINYRTTIHNINPPCVPFIGVYQTDLTFIEENPDKFSSGKINFKKFRMIANVIEEIHQYQMAPFNLAAVPVIQEFILKSSENMSKLAEKELFSLSLVAEPRPQ